MTFRHVFVSLAVTCLVACSSDDTIVSLNVTATDRVPVVERMQVTFKQGSRSFVYDFAPPEDNATEETPASIKNSFFQRITLPGDWDEAEAKISVEAFGEGDDSFDPPLVDDTTAKIEPEGVVAAYVELDIPEPPPVGGAGGEGAGGAPSDGGAPAEGGAPSSGGVPSGGAPSEVGGEANAGGTVGDVGGAGGVGGAG